MDNLIKKIFQKGSGGHFNRVSAEDHLKFGSKNYFNNNVSRKIPVSLISEENEKVEKIPEKEKTISLVEILERQEIKKEQMKNIWKETIGGVEKEIKKIAKIFDGESKLSKDQLEEYIKSIINHDDEEVVAIFEDIFAQKLVNHDSIIVLTEKQREILLSAIKEILPNDSIKENPVLEKNSQNKIDIAINIKEKKVKKDIESPFIKEVSEIVAEDENKKIENDSEKKEQEDINRDTFTQELPTFIKTNTEVPKEKQNKLEKKFKKAISFIEDISREDFLKKYEENLEPMFIGDYRDLLGEILIYMNDHHIDKFSEDSLEKFQAALDIVENLNKKGHQKKMLVSDGKTYLVDKNIKEKEKNKFKLTSEEKEFILINLPNVVSFVKEEFTAMKLETVYLGEIKEEFFKVKTLSLIALGIKEHFSCSNEDAVENAREIFEDFEKNNKHK